MFKKIFIIMLISNLSFNVNSMKRVLPVEDEKIDFLSSIPDELKEQIILLLHLEDLQEVSKDLQNLSLINKKYNKIINNPQFIGNFILHKLGQTGKEFDKNSLWRILNFVDFLKLPGAYNWFEIFINLNTNLIGKDNINQLFHEAIARKNIKLINIMLNNPLVDVNSLNGNGYPAIIQILWPNPDAKSVEIANMLFYMHGFNINARISASAMAGREDLDPDAGSGLLHLAVKYKDINLLKYLLELKGIDINLRNELTGQTPLALAQSMYITLSSKRGHGHIINILKKAGADIAGNVSKGEANNLINNDIKSANQDEYSLDYDYEEDFDSVEKELESLEALIELLKKNGAIL